VKRLPFFPQWLIMSLILLLALSACERPVPGSDSAESPDVTEPTIAPIEIPTAVPTAEAPDTEPATAPGAAEPAEPGAADSEPAGEGAATEAPTEPAADTTAPAEPEATQIIHTVQAGDTLSHLADFYNVSIEDIAAANGITDIDTLDAGQQLIIPAAGTAAATTVPSEGGELTHTVTAGENLFRIGLVYGFTIEELASYNGITDPERIEIGQVIRIPPSH